MIFFVALAILFNIYQFASGAAINLPYQNLTGTNTNFCTDNQDWIAPGSYAQHCIGAVQRLYDIEVASRRTPKTDYEFLTPKARPGSIQEMRTPRKYTYGRLAHSQARIEATC